MKQSKIYLLTFVSIALIILIFGYFGVSRALDYMQKKYIELQIDVNKRQAEGMVRILRNQLKQGETKTELIGNFQLAIEGTRADKGFMCMYATDSLKLVCHPDIKMLGMQFPESFIKNHSCFIN